MRQIVPVYLFMSLCKELFSFTKELDTERGDIQTFTPWPLKVAEASIQSCWSFCRSVLMVGQRAWYKKSGSSNIYFPAARVAAFELFAFIAEADLGFQERGSAGYAFGIGSEAPWHLAVGRLQGGGGCSPSLSKIFTRLKLSRRLFLKGNVNDMVVTSLI